MVSFDEIQMVIPHRYPFIFLDCVEEYEKGKYAKGIKNVTANEWFFQGHFPQEKVMPGVLIVESLAQLGAFLLMVDGASKGKIPFFGSLDKVKFRKIVRPGDKLCLEVEVEGQKGAVGSAKIKATVDGELAVSGVLTYILR